MSEGLVKETTIGLTIPGNGFGLGYSSYKVERTIVFPEPVTSEMAAAYEQDEVRSMTDAAIETFQEAIKKLGEAAPAVPVPAVPGFTQAAPVQQAAPQAPAGTATADSAAGIGALVNGHAAAPAGDGGLLTVTNRYGKDVTYPSEQALPKGQLEAAIYAALPELEVDPSHVQVWDNRGGNGDGVVQSGHMAAVKLPKGHPLHSATRGYAIAWVDWDLRTGRVKVYEAKGSQGAAGPLGQLKIADRAFLAAPLEGNAF